MSSPADKKAALNAYIDCFNAADLDGLLALFADNATVEDPVGTPAKQGKAAIRDFYQTAVSTGAKLALAAPIRGSHGDAAAMAFTVDVAAAKIRINVIDVMTFDTSGKIGSMKAYWAPDDAGPY